jgi:hypothetical protein
MPLKDRIMSQTIPFTTPQLKKLNIARFQSTVQQQLKAAPFQNEFNLTHYPFSSQHIFLHPADIGVTLASAGVASLQVVSGLQCEAG